MGNDDDDDDDKGALPLTPATSLLFENFVLGQRATPQGVVTLEAEVINPLPPIAAEMAELHGVRAEGE